ncbi:hypothetical protein ElyMa_001384700 [Elysia marginata]|uniref:Uncharacterized protein n=1 Tax=Elysia marginata TaxID=1093978 RepID=A0AAV4IUI4_9GAST|nr:hypothetical protein ElyMa_001384700 [Elysia marginata]
MQHNILLDCVYFNGHRYTLQPKVMFLRPPEDLWLPGRPADDGRAHQGCTHHRERLTRITFTAEEVMSSFKLVGQEVRPGSSKVQSGPVTPALRDPGSDKADVRLNYRKRASGIYQATQTS